MSSFTMLRRWEIIFFTAVTVMAAILLKTWSGRKNRRKRSQLPDPPSIPSLPIVGSIPYMRKHLDNLPRFFMKKSEELGPIFTFMKGNRQCLVLNSLEAIEEALVRNATCFADRPGSVLDRLTGNTKDKGVANALFDANYKKYHILSLSILKEFGFGIRQTMETRISMEVSEIVDYVNIKNGKPFDPEEMLLQASANVGLSILFSKRDPYDNGLSRFCRLAIDTVNSALVALNFAPWLRFIPPFRGPARRSFQLAAELMEQFEQYVKSIKAGETDECFVSRYIEKEGPDYDHEQLIYTLRDLTLGAIDTTANTLLWTFVFLANNQSVQQRLQKDIDEEVPRDRLPAFDDKSRLPYLEAVILEVMRLRSLLPLALPHHTLNDCELLGFFIPGGTIVFPNLYAAHMDEKQWPDPNVFKPERFLDEYNNVINREKCIPFSLGRRSCLGEVLARQELIQFISGLVQNFTILPEEDNIRIDEAVRAGILTKPKQFQLRMIQRRK